MPDPIMAAMDVPSGPVRVPLSRRRKLPDMLTVVALTAEVVAAFPVLVHPSPCPPLSHR